MHQRFKNWCRLCARTNGCTRDLLVKDDSIPDLCLTIEKHFSLQIKLNNDAPTTICDECHEWLLKLIQFEEIVLRSQSKFECTTFIEPIEENSYDIEVDFSSFYEEVKEEEDAPEAVQLDIPCEHCEKSFRSEESLYEHMNTHTADKLSCDICGTKFGKSFSLRNHKKLVHSNVRPFICDECGGAFKRSGDLTRHKEFHRDDAQFACRICDKRFKSKLVVKMHEKNHNDEKFMCNICGQELKTKNTLRGHLLTHSDEMKFKCKYCCKKFRHNKNLNCHLLTHTGLQPYSCAFCKKPFSLRWNCRTHQKRVHAVDVARYEQEGKSTIVTNKVKQKFACGRRQTTDSGAVLENDLAS